jgi:hypothetical protein
MNLRTRRRTAAAALGGLLISAASAVGQGTPAAIAFSGDETRLDVTVEGTSWSCDLEDYECRRAEPRRQSDDRAPTRLSPDRKREALIVNRSKPFQDVAWKNLGDAGFPDRIAWHNAVAARYPWYDISRVGKNDHRASTADPAEPE